MIDYEVYRDKWFNVGRISAGALGGVAHCREIDDQWDSGKVLKDDPSDCEGDFEVTRGFSIPIGEIFDVRFGDFTPI
jgi:hypothetical protein